MTQDSQKICVAIHGQPSIMSAILCALHEDNIELVVDKKDFDRVLIWTLWIETDDDLRIAAQLSKSYESKWLLGLTTIVPQAEFVRKAMSSGIHGYTHINFREDKSMLCKAIKDLVSNGIYISPQFTKLLLKQHDVLSNPENLSATQQRVAKCISERRTNKEIAEQLKISKETVKKHVSQILHKYGVPTRAHLWGREIK